MYIYKTTNLVNNKIYVGKSEKNFDPNYYGSGVLLLKAIKKYGKQYFKVEIIEECHCIEDLNFREKYWIDYYKRSKFETYNLAEGGTGGHTTKFFDKDRIDEYKKKLSSSRKGRKISFETRLKISQANKGRFEGDRNVISESIKSLWNDPDSIYNSKEYRQKLSDCKIGRIHSKETRKKISEGRLGGNNPYAVKVMVGDKIYETRRACAIEHGISEPAVTKRCKSKSFPDWKLI